MFNVSFEFFWFQDQGWIQLSFYLERCWPAVWLWLPSLFSTLMGGEFVTIATVGSPYFTFLFQLKSPPLKMCFAFSYFIWMLDLHCAEWCMCRVWHSNAGFTFICWSGRVSLWSPWIWVERTWLAILYICLIVNKLHAQRPN